SKTRVNALLTRASIVLRKRVLPKGMDCRVEPGNDKVAASRPRGDDNRNYRGCSGGGNAIQVRSRMLRWQASANATSRMPAVKSHASGAPAATCRRNASHPTR